MNNHDKIYCHKLIRHFRDKCSSVEMLKGYMLTCLKAEGYRVRERLEIPTQVHCSVEKIWCVKRKQTLK